jgi:hypothetical protein
MEEVHKKSRMVNSNRVKDAEVSPPVCSSARAHARRSACLVTAATAAPAVRSSRSRRNVSVCNTQSYQIMRCGIRTWFESAGNTIVVPQSYMGLGDVVG